MAVDIQTAKTQKAERFAYEQRMAQRQYNKIVEFSLRFPKPLRKLIVKLRIALLS